MHPLSHEAELMMHLQEPSAPILELFHGIAWVGRELNLRGSDHEALLQPCLGHDGHLLSFRCFGLLGVDSGHVLLLLIMEINCTNVHLAENLAC